jgi:hypothetical protein
VVRIHSPRPETKGWRLRRRCPFLLGGPLPCSSFTSFAVPLPADCTSDPPTTYRTGCVGTMTAARKPHGMVFHGCCYTQRPLRQGLRPFVGNATARWVTGGRNLRPFWPPGADGTLCPWLARSPGRQVGGSNPLAPTRNERRPFGENVEGLSFCHARTLRLSVAGGKGNQGVMAQRKPLLSPRFAGSPRHAHRR